MDAAFGSCRRDSSTGCFDISGNTSCQAGDGWAFDFLGDCLDRREISVAYDRKPGFNDIDLQSCQLSSHLHFLAQVHGSSGALLSIAQRGVKNLNTLGSHDNITRIFDFVPWQD